MRLISATAALAILFVALYLALVWGLDAFRLLSVSLFDQPQYWRSQVFAVGSYAGLDRAGMIWFALFFGAYALAVAALFATHAVERLISVFGYRPDRGLLHLGLFVVLVESGVTLVVAQHYELADLERAALINLSIVLVALAWSIAEGRARRSKPAERTIDNPMPPNSFPIPAPDDRARQDVDAAPAAPLASSRSGGLRLVELKPDPA